VERAHLVEIEVFNHKARTPSYAIEVEDLRAGQPADKRCFFLKISPKSAQVAAYRRIPTKRGRDHHVGFRIATRFPFGLFEKSREVTAEGELVIYPAVDAVELPPSLPGRTAGGDGIIGRGHGEDFLVVMRERAREARPDVSISLDVLKPADGGEAWDHAFERRIRDAASRAVAHVKRGDTVAIRTNAGDAARADRAAGADPLLRYLALVEAVPAATSLAAKPTGAAPAATTPEKLAS
jgi:uncharacterized protein (DUF58 family)